MGIFGIADLHAACSQVSHLIAGHPDLLRPPVYLNRVLAEVGEQAFFDRAIRGAHHLDRRRNVVSRLHINVAGGRDGPVRMREGKVAQRNIVHKLIGFRVALEPDQLRKIGGNHFAPFDVFARQWNV